MRLRNVNTRQDKHNLSLEMEADRVLATRMLEGDHEALRLWLDSHLSAVFGYLERRLGPGNESLASEITGATFERALRRIGPYAKGSAATPMRLWLLRLAGEQLRKTRPKAIAAPKVVENKQVTYIRRSIEALPPRKQAAVALALFEGLSVEDLAAALGTTVPGAMRVLRGALRDVGKTLGPQLAKSGENQ